MRSNPDFYSLFDSLPRNIDLTKYDFIPKMREALQTCISHQAHFVHGEKHRKVAFRGYFLHR
jgi:hypothetical protein